ncbi:MAG TPA: malto-oligosyltrehalose trehalohydrolase [Vicinamibacterales bacterium]
MTSWNVVDLDGAAVQPRRLAGTAAGTDSALFSGMELEELAAFTADRARTFEPRFGAVRHGTTVTFRVWAPSAHTVKVVVEGDASRGTYEMSAARNHFFEASLPNIEAGTRYRYCLDDDRLLPDPASRHQPDGPHGPSAVVDPAAFVWTDADWRGVPAERLAIYEMHVGTFTDDGTFAAAESRLGAIADLGITAIELMPIAECAGRWNWGYDGVDLFAPSHNYGTPDDLRRFVNAAHAHGIAVILDVVYNHFGPEGAYVHAFSPYFTTDGYHTPWGPGVNLDREHSKVVRAFFIENALHWVHEYHVDGLRLDACHELRDERPRHFLAELIQTVRRSVETRTLVFIAEDERNCAELITNVGKGGYGFDGVWADDFHHHVRRAVAGDSEGYYRSYSGTVEDIVETLRRGWFYVGQQCEHLNAPRGSDPGGLPLERFIICLQNHDQVGNRALGERLHHQIDLSVYRALTALLLLAPETPLLFMGQEWAASTPFLFFTDHESTLGQAVTEGRRAEFAAFSAFADPATRDRIPDPQDPQSFRASQLAWDEREDPSHAAILRLHKTLLNLRLAFWSGSRGPATIVAVDDATIAMTLSRENDRVAVLVVRIAGEGNVTIDGRVGDDRCRDWRVIMTTEDAGFVQGGQVPAIAQANPLTIAFRGAAALVLEGRTSR